MNAAVPVIAIDGPFGLGQGTVAQKVAQALGFRYLDSGALYRLVTLASLERAWTPATSTTSPASPDHADRFPRRPDVARRARRDGGIALRSGERGRRRGWLRTRRAPRACWPARGAFARRPGSSPTAATWAPWCSRTPPEGVPDADVAHAAERRYKQLMEKGMYAKMRTLWRSCGAATTRQHPTRGAAKALSRRSFSRYHRVSADAGGAKDLGGGGKGADSASPAKPKGVRGLASMPPPGDINDGLPSFRKSRFPCCPKPPTKPHPAAENSFAALFEESLSRQEMRIGEVITAEVVSVDPNVVIVNAGLKSESTIAPKNSRTTAAKSK
jgi:hypothetical protein